MNHDEVCITRVLQAPVARVWKALTNASDMKQWYFDLPGFRAEVGYAFEFYGGKDPEHLYLHRCVVTEVVPFRRLQYSWRYEGYAGDSVVTIDLQDQGEETQLTLRHSGLSSFPADNTDLASTNFAQGWDYIVNTALTNFVEQQDRS